MYPHSLIIQAYPTKSFLVAFSTWFLLPKCERLVILPPIEIYKYNVMILYYNIKFRHFLPAIEFRENVSTHDFRFPNQLFVPQPRTNAYKINFQYCIPTIWNSIPPEIRSIRTVTKFKREYKKNLIMNFIWSNNWYILMMIYIPMFQVFLPHQQGCKHNIKIFILLS